VGVAFFLLSFVESLSVSPSRAVKFPINPSYSGLIPHSTLARFDFLSFGSEVFGRGPISTKAGDVARL